MFFYNRRQKLCQKNFFSTSIRQLIASLSIRDIENNIYNFNEYVVVDLFMNDHVINVEEKNSATNRFSIEIYIVDELKINLLIDNDVFNAQRMSLKLKIQTATLISCRNLKIFIDITAKKNIDQRRIIRFKINFKISAEIIVQMSILYHDNLSNDRDFFFEFQCNQLLDLNENVFVYIVNAFLNHVMMRNIIQHSIILQKRVRLKTLIDYNQQECYNLTSNADFLIINDWKITKQHQRIWKNKLDMTVAAIIYVVSSTTDMISFSFSFSSFKLNAATNVNSIFVNSKTSFFIVIDSTLKHVMSNDVIIYDESNVIARITKMINVYSIVWNDQNITIDIFKKQWISIILKSDVEILKSTRIYSVEFKNRTIIDVIFDKMHKKDKMTWVIQFTFFNFSTFVIWRNIVNDVKKRVIMNIRDLNKITLTNFYSLSLQSNIINAITDYEYINIVDDVNWFHQFNVQKTNCHKFIVISHRDQKQFNVALMSFKNSSSYVQR